MKTQITLIAAMSVLALPGLANAAPVEGNTRIVRLADLNLASDAGRARAETRITAAAKAVCGGGYERTLQAQSAFHGCYDHARSDALFALRAMTATVEVASR